METNRQAALSSFAALLATLDTVVPEADLSEKMILNAVTPFEQVLLLQNMLELD